MIKMIMHLTQAKVAIALLEKWAKGVDSEMFHCGLCTELTFDEHWQDGWICGSALVEHYAPSWPLYSGDTQFPIPNPRRGGSPSDAYKTYDKWSKRSKYGRMRYDLCIFMANSIRRDYNLVDWVQNVEGDDV